jgi:hypothetical protein
MQTPKVANQEMRLSHDSFQISSDPLDLIEQFGQINGDGWHMDIGMARVGDTSKDMWN